MLDHNFKHYTFIIIINNNELVIIRKALLYDAALTSVSTSPEIQEFSGSFGIFKDIFEN